MEILYTIVYFYCVLTGYRIKLRPFFIVSLSGGGYRASLFHAGVLRALFDKGIISSDREYSVIINAVSGGAIPAMVWNTFLHAHHSLQEKDPAWPEKSILELVTKSPRFGGRINWWFRGREMINRFSWSAFLERWWASTSNSLPAFWTNQEVALVLLEALDYITGVLWVFTGDNSICEPDDLFFATGRSFRHCEGIPVHTALAAATAHPILFCPRKLKLNFPGYTDPVQLELVDAGAIDNQGIHALLPLFKKNKDGDSIIQEGDHWFFSNAEGRMPLPEPAYDPWQHSGKTTTKVDKLNFLDRLERFTGPLIQPTYTDQFFKFISDYVGMEACGVRIGLLPSNEKPWVTTPLLPNEDAMALIPTSLSPLSIEDSVCVMALGFQTANYVLNIDSEKLESTRTMLSLISSNYK